MIANVMHCFWLQNYTAHQHPTETITDKHYQLLDIKYIISSDIHWCISRLFLGYCCHPPHNQRIHACQKLVTRFIHWEQKIIFVSWVCWFTENRSRYLSPFIISVVVFWLGCHTYKHTLLLFVICIAIIPSIL